MRTVWKYPVQITDVFTLTMPRGAEILHVAMQFELPYLWAWVNPDEPTETRTFAIVGTGNPAPEPDDSFYHGTFQHMGGQLIWHLFEERRP